MAWFSVPTEIAREIVRMKGRLSSSRSSIQFWDSNGNPVDSGDLEEVCDRIDCMLLADRLEAEASGQTSDPPTGERSSQASATAPISSCLYTCTG